jgi:hypothetical protein
MDGLGRVASGQFETLRVVHRKRGVRRGDES